MASKIDQLTLAGTQYDIDLPVDATPSIKSITLAEALNLTNGLTNYNGVSYYLPSNLPSGTTSVTLATTLNNVEITFNGQLSSQFSFWAPTESGTKGNVLYANSSGIPTWGRAVSVIYFNSATTASYGPTIFAPTNGGPAGYLLVATGASAEPSWKKVFSYDSATHTLNIITS